jgi:Yip1-like protein
MSDTLAPPVEAPATQQGLLGRAVGVITSPRRAYAGIVARPRILGALGLIVALTASANLVFYNTRVGQDALLDQQIRTVESFGRQVDDTMYANLERQAPFAGYITAASIIVVSPLVMLLVAGLAFVVFNAILGAASTFKQTLAVVVHSGFVGTLAQFFVLPLNYVRESISSPANLGVFLPFLDENSFAARFLGSVDLVLIWGLVNLAIGLGVLYKRRTGPIATGLLIVYLVIVLVVAAVRSALSGA